MRVTTLLMPAALTLLATATPLMADEPQTRPAVGARVRIEAPGFASGRLIGRLEGVSPDALSLRVEDQRALVRVPRDEVRKIELSRGRRSIGKSVLIGLGIGAVAGALAYNTCDPQGDDCASTRQNLRSGAILGAPLGAVIGVVVGAAGRERWQPVAPERLFLGLTPARRGGLAASMSFAF